MKITAKDGTCMEIDESTVKSDDWGVLSFHGVLSGLTREQRTGLNAEAPVTWETEEPIRFYVALGGFALMQQAAAATRNRSQKSKAGPATVALLDTPKWRRRK